jgi:hypothetical protein
MEDLSAAEPAALAERVPPAETERLAGLLQRSPVLTELLDAVPGFFMVLNRTRQIVFANRGLRGLLEPQGRDCAAGLRPGEALACCNSAAAAGGCGRSDRCVDCGAFKAILACQRDSPAVEECRLFRGCSREAMDLRVFTTPLRHEGESFVVLAAEDISSEKRRESLERCFMHDVANTVSGILCAAELLRGGLSGKAQEAAEAVLRGSRHLLEEVRAQRDLLAAEAGDLVIQDSPFAGRLVLEEVEAFYRGQPWTASRYLRIVEGLPKPALISDRTLVGRILGNMLKNALEAARQGDTVT